MESLVPALTGVDALLFAVASAHTRSEIPIIDAAVAAGVRFVIPTEYGLPTTHWTFADVGTFAAKRAVHAQLAALREAGKLDYTLVFVGLWLDITGLAGFVVDAKNKKQELWDDGEHPISLTMTESIAQAVVAVLEGKAAGKTEVRVKNINLSQRRLRELCEEVVGSDGWEITHYDTEERTKVARQKFQAGTADVADHYSFVRRGAGAPGYGSPWKPEEDDSAALGLKEWSEDDVVDFIRKYVNTK
jgi:nucleoside-diphosphate-sugar epimerase